MPDIEPIDGLVAEMSAYCARILAIQIQENAGFLSSSKPQTPELTGLFRQQSPCRLLYRALNESSSVGWLFYFPADFGQLKAK